MVPVMLSFRYVSYSQPVSREAHISKYELRGILGIVSGHFRGSDESTMNVHLRDR